VLGIQIAATKQTWSFFMPDKQPSATRRPEGTKFVRPTEYTSEIGKTICDRLVEDESLRSICAQPGMPDVATVASWISDNPEFRERYAFAREFQAQSIGDEMPEIIDALGSRWVEKVRANGRVALVRDRKRIPGCYLRLEVRHWVFDELLARARALSDRRIFEIPLGPEEKFLSDPQFFSDMMKEPQHD
jgi:hypothetical protein